MFDGHGRSNMKSGTGLGFLVLATLSSLIMLMFAHAVAQGPSDGLQTPEGFSTIADEKQRSAAYFTELGKVLTHPRCMNCHPAGDRPRQGEHRRPHQPPVGRGPDGFGLTALRCPVCHQAANFDPCRVPGHPLWHLAPLEM